MRKEEVYNLLEQYESKLVLGHYTYVIDGCFLVKTKEHMYFGNAIIHYSETIKLISIADNKIYEIPISQITEIN